MTIPGPSFRVWIAIRFAISRLEQKHPNTLKFRRLETHEKLLRSQFWSAGFFQFADDKQTLLDKLISWYNTDGPSGMSKDRTRNGPYQTDLNMLYKWSLVFPFQYNLKVSPKQQNPQFDHSQAATCRCNESQCNNQVDWYNECRHFKLILKFYNRLMRLT